MVAAGMPSEEREGDAGEEDERECVWGGMEEQAQAAQRRTAATEPQVPGPGLPKPAPKKVATVHAHHFVAFWFWTGLWEGSVFIGVLARLPPSSPRSSRTSGSRMGELIL